MKRDLKRLRQAFSWLVAVVGCTVATSLYAQQTDSSQYPVQKIKAARSLPPVQSHSGQETQPQFRQTAAIAAPRIAKMSRRLSNIGWEQFENRIVELWGDKLRARAEDEQGSLVRILIPGDGYTDNQMLIDRSNNAVTFEGDPSVAANWESLISVLDQADETNNGSIRLVGMGNVSPNTVRHAIGLLGMSEEDSGSMAETLKFAPFASKGTPRQRRSQLRSIPYQPESGARKKASQNDLPRQSRQPSVAPRSPAPSRANQPNGNQIPRPAMSKAGSGSSARLTPVATAGTPSANTGPLSPKTAAAENPFNTPAIVESPAVPARTASASTVSTPVSTSSTRSATYSVAVPQEEEGSAAQEEGQDNRMQIVERTSADQLDGQVKIQIMPEMNAIMLIGDPEDVAKVRRMIQGIVNTAGDTQPISKVIDVENTDSAVLKETLDTVYEAGQYEASNGSVEIVAIDNPNRLFVVGQEAAVATIEGLIAQLDSASPETDGALDYVFYRFKHISAIDAAQRLQGYFRQSPEDGTQTGQQIDPGEWIAAFEGPVSFVVDYRSNALIVKGNKRVLETAEKFLAKLDVDETETSHVVRFFPLYNAAATDVAQILQTAINGQYQGAPQVNAPGAQTQNQNFQNNGGTNFGGQGQQSTLPVTALKMTTVGDDGRTIQSGILLEVRFNADINSNQIMVTGPEKSMELVAALIKQLDRIPDAETQIKVFTIFNGDAQELLTTMQDIFGSNQTQQLQGGGNAGGQSIAQLPLQSAGATDGGSLINLRFAVDTRTNSILASGPAGDLQLIDSLLNRLDEEDLSNRVNDIYRLSNAPAEDVAAAISEWIQARQDVFDSDPTSDDAFVSARRQIVVVPELVSNSLLISATPVYYQELIRLIEELDRQPPMVKIKVLIAEVNLNKLSEFGVEVGIQDSLLFDRGLGSIGFPFNQAGIGNLNVGREVLAGQGLSSLGIGRTNGDVGYGGLVLSAGNESINILMRALQDRAIARVLSTPDIMTVDNLQGRIQVGQSVSRVSGVTPGNNVNGTVTTQVESVDVGVILEVTPRVSPDGMIIMSVDAINSSLGSEADGVPVFANDNQVIRSPPINITQAQTTIMARSGQSVAFSGLISDRVAESKRGTPILSDLPVIGPLFSFETEDHSRSELLIVLTPYLVDGDAQLEASNQMSYSRMNWCEADVASIYSGINGYDPELAASTVPATYYPDSDPTGNNPELLPIEPSVSPDVQYQQIPAESFRQVPDRRIPVPRTSPSPSDVQGSRSQ